MEKIMDEPLWCPQCGIDHERIDCLERPDKSDSCVCPTMLPLLSELYEKLPVVFEGIAEKVR